ncbi:MAG: excinuclease ABC subunit UvrA [Candidatus Aminicenantes bacterium]|nr:excinuclease ABC subunit UvrA [Candidatus Aminicenantes bacterium]
MNPTENKTISVRGASEHNLKSIDADIPQGQLTVVTGVSGSGKSSLVFDTIYKEARRRYLESFSTYARQFLGKLGRPPVEHIDGLSPAIAIDQKSVTRNPRSTVGTMSELYDYLRLLFARLGTVETTTEHGPVKLERRLFSFNSPYGACPACKGLGVRDQIDPQLLIRDPQKTLRQGALAITTPSGYIIYSQVTMEVLNRVCEAEGFNVDIPWLELTPEQQKIVLFGSNKLKIPFGKHPLESRLRWSGITAKPREEAYYKGIIPIMAAILKVKRNPNILRFARSMTCDACAGTRLNPDALAVTFRGKNIAQLAASSIDGLNDFFAGLKFPTHEAPVGEAIREVILKCIALLRELGLGYLTLDRESTTLSGGEAQRIRLATQVGSELRGILYILDEPSIGLHHRDNARLLAMLRRLRDNGNTLIVVEHDEDTIRSADRLIDIGPGAGVDGGEILFNGPVHHLWTAEGADKQLDRSRTRAFLTGIETIPVPTVRRPGSGKILQVIGAAQHNLKNIDVPFRLGALNVVSGVSGAGKSTLVHHILAKFLRNRLHGAVVTAGKHAGIEGVEYIDKIIEIDQSPIGRTPRSNPATYTKLFDHIRDLFAGLPESRARKWDKGRFSFNVKGGRCETCEGAGQQEIGMHFLGNVEVVCEECGGKRFNDETLEVRYNGKNIHDILETSIAGAVEFFKGQSQVSRFLTALLDLGLAYVTLGQSAVTLSGGEAQRIKLAAELSKPATGSTLYILDEPTTGLHAADIKILLSALNRLVDKGNTVIMVEHHPDIIKCADWVIDLGPESGERGGELAALGTPEEVARSKRSHTGQLLAKVLGGVGTLSQKGPDPPEASQPPEAPIFLKGVTTHNLKNIDVEIPVNRLTVITGVSGSGKSSLAFDTIFAEGQQRFMSGFSTYARQMMGSAGRAEIESCSGLMPAIAVSRKTATGNPRSTVGTITEIYDYYRLLFARVGKTPDAVDKPLNAGMFSFNHHQGACPHCKGLGVVTACDPRRLATHPDRSLLDGALDGTKTGTFYGDLYGQYIAILQAVGQEKGMDFSRPWNQLDDDARRIAMYGTGEKTYAVTWKFKRKNRVGEHRFERTWQGFVNYVNEEYRRKHADKRGQAMLPLMTDQTCPQCHGRRLKPEVLAVYFAGVNIAQLCSMSVKDSIAFFRELGQLEQTHASGPDRVSERELQITRQLRDDVLRRLEFLQDVGLGYVAPDRSSASLSGGEAQRIRLAGQLGSGLTGVIYVLDEPTIGLHSRDTLPLLRLLYKLRDLGNTVIVVEHDADVIRAADHIIDLGPGAGRDGGFIVARGTVAQVMENEASATGKYLKNPNAIPVPAQRRRLGEGLKIKGAFSNNLKHIDVHIPSGGLIAITGVSGSGKSSLLFDVAAASAEAGFPVGCDAIEGFHRFGALVTMDQSPIGAASSSASNPATYTGLFDKIRDLFAQTEPARARGYKKNHFSFNVKGGRCETCRGMGEIYTSMDFLADVWTPCEECKGKRYNQETLECTFQSKNIADVLDMTIREALDFFSQYKDIHRILEQMEAVGLGYLQLGQPANTLSGGEAQRLKLVTELIKGKSKNNLYFFDEPTTGLHFEDIKKLLELFHRLVEAGHTLVVIEHHPDIIKNADYVIELGPEGGELGGHAVRASYL